MDSTVKKTGGLFPSDIRGRAPYQRPRFALPALILLGLLLHSYQYLLTTTPQETKTLPRNADLTIAKCKLLHVKPGPPSSFHDRAVSDRHVSGTKPVWVRNATLWTGNANGTEVVTGDLLLADGLIKAVGIIPDALLRAYTDVESIDARGAWVTPG